MKKAIWKTSGATVRLTDARYEKLLKAGHIVPEEKPAQRRKPKASEAE